MLNGPKRTFGGAALMAAVLGVSIIPSAPSSAEPDIDDVQTRVDRLYHQAEQASERYNDAKIKLDDLNADLTGLKGDEKTQERRVGELADDVGDSILRQYQGRTLDATAELVASDDPNTFLDSLTTMDTVNDSQAQIVTDYDREVDTLDARRGATKDRADELREVKNDLAKEKDTIDDKLADAKDLLANLKEKDRKRVLEASRDGSTTRVPTNVPASGRASAAVNYALAQVGDSYVYGAAGPNAFDCSGLTMMAWGQAGVGLPHSSSAQMGSGTRVSSSALKPGDLVFYYSPVSHVGIYIGNGQIVHAANPSTGVVVAGVFSMPFSGAVRPG